ncbi:hypothetical protein RC62_4060 [Flavobacterium aquidurense]|uniref:Uncharacterized protein n=1 Tax=Flavobacterium aquidurense TaxID=362413 RepID=A0A0Q0SBA8_9FLAO|nr:hypothetical protein RC62_4060 [Flavobacterium aquidurense]
MRRVNLQIKLSITNNIYMKFVKKRTQLHLYKQISNKNTALVDYSGRNKIFI